MTEIHPYNNYCSIPEATRLLIIGTAPPKRFSKPRFEGWEPPSEDDVDFYYGSKHNQLWRRIFPQLYPASFLAGLNRSADEQRSFLKDKGMWMHDICQEYTRDGSGALDQHLNVTKFADMRRILEERVQIDTLVFTGGSAETWSGKRMEEQRLIAKYSFGEKGIGKLPMSGRQRTLAIDTNRGKRTVRTFTVPSPSRRATTTNKVELYRAAICD